MMMTMMTVAVVSCVMTGHMLLSDCTNEVVHFSQQLSEVNLINFVF